MSTDNATLSPEDFDVISFIEGSNFPEKHVTVYTNGKAGIALREEKEKPTKQQDKALIADLEGQVDASALTFHLRGLAPKAVEVLMKKLEINSKDQTDEERLQKFMESTDSLVAATIVSVKRADGATDSRAWDTDRAAALRGALMTSEYERLAEAVNVVNFDAKAFNDKVDAGFPGGRTEQES